MKYTSLTIPAGSNNGFYLVGTRKNPTDASVDIYGEGNKLQIFGGSLGIYAWDSSGGNHAIFTGRAYISDYGNGNRYTEVGDSNNYAYIAGRNASIGLGDGNNSLSDYGYKTTFSLGDGGNWVNLGGVSAIGWVGDGDNTVNTTAMSFKSTLIVGDGDNSFQLGGYRDTIFAGDGANTITLGETSYGNRVTVGDGPTNLYVSGLRHTITVGDGSVYADINAKETKLTIGDGDYTVNINEKDARFMAGDGDGYVHINAKGAVVKLGGEATVIGSPFGDNITIQGEGDNGSNPSYADGGAGDDTITAMGKSAYILGGPGSDWLKVGEEGTAYGGAGNDTLGGGPNSSLYGGAGNDRMTFMPGSQISPGAGKDTLIPVATAGENGWYSWVTGFARGDVLDMSRLSAQRDPCTDFFVGISGGLLEVQITIRGVLTTLNIGGMDAIGKAGIASAAMGGMITGLPENFKTFMVSEKG